MKMVCLCRCVSISPGSAEAGGSPIRARVQPGLRHSIGIATRDRNKVAQVIPGELRFHGIETLLDLVGTGSRKRDGGREPSRGGWSEGREGSAWTHVEPRDSTSARGSAGTPLATASDALIPSTTP